MAPKKQPKKKPNAPLTRTWKEIRQTGTEKAFTPAAQKRKMATVCKASVSLLVLILTVGAGTWFAIQWLQEPESKLGNNRAEPVSRIVFETNGVLSQEWVGRILTIRRGTTLVDISIFDLKRRLEEQGQVETAEVERQYPDTLKVRLWERMPAARLAVEDGFGGYEIMLVGPDGVVYRGKDYDDEFLKTLPFLDGVALRRNSRGDITPIGGMDLVSEFLSRAQQHFPAFYADLRVVDLSGIREGVNMPGAGIHIRGKRYPDIRFSTTEFPEQLEKLEYVVHDLRDRLENEKREQVKGIDLSLEGPVVVSFNPAPN